MENNLVTLNHTKDNIIEFDITTEGVESNDITVNFVIKTQKMNIVFEAKNKKGDTWSVKIPPLNMLEKTAYTYHISVVADGYYFQPLKGTVNVVGSAELYSTAPKNVTYAPKSEQEESQSKSNNSDNNKSDKKEKNTSAKSTPKTVDNENKNNKSTTTKKEDKKEDSKQKSNVSESDKKHKFSLGIKTTKPKNTEHEEKKENEQIKKEEKKENNTETTNKTEKKVDETKQPPIPVSSENQSKQIKSVEQIARRLMEQQKFKPEKIEEKIEEVKEQVEAVPPGKGKDEKVLKILEEAGIKPKKRERISLIKAKDIFKD